jgi:hypothetical protein
VVALMATACRCRCCRCREVVTKSHGAVGRAAVDEILKTTAPVHALTEAKVAVEVSVRHTTSPPHFAFSSAACSTAATAVTLHFTPHRCSFTRM